MENQLERTKVAIIGALGRMGVNNLKIVNSKKNLEVVSAVDHKSHKMIGKKVTSLVSDFNNQNLVFSCEDVDAILKKKAEIFIDFSSPQATCQFLSSLKEKSYKGCYIIGTTGFDENQEELIKQIGNNFLIIKSGNFNIGVNVLSNLVEKTNRVLKDYDIEIIEHHHNQKVDAPSGTAKMLLNACNSKERKIVHGREGIIGKRQKNEIGMSVVRGGGIIGKHEVHFISNNDQLSLIHNAFHRDAFTSGVLLCVEFYLKNPNKIGSLNMKEVLGLENF